MACTAESKSTSPSSRMLNKSASGVLASLPAAVKRETRISSGTAALLDGYVEHPAGLFFCCPTRANHRSSRVMKLPAVQPSQLLPVLRSPFRATTEGEEWRRSRPSCGVFGEILRVYSAEVASATKAGSRYPPSPRLRRVLLALPTPPKQPLRLRRPGIPAVQPSQLLPVRSSPIWATTEGEEGRRSRPSYGVFGEGE